MEKSMGSSLDALTTSGVIGFDAESYIKGTNANSFGSSNSSETYLPGEQPLFNSPNIPLYGIYGGSYLQGQPNKDAFVAHNHSIKNWKEGNVSLKNLLTAGIVGTLAVLTGKKVKKGLSEKGSESLSKSGIAKKISGCLERLKNKFDKIAANGAPAAATKADGAKETVEKVANTISKRKIKIPKQVKIGGLAIAGTLGLYEIYRFIQDKKAAIQRG